MSCSDPFVTPVWVWQNKENETSKPVEPVKHMKVKLTNVRLSYPSLFKARAFEDNQDPRYEATFLLDKREHAALIKSIREGAVQMLKDHYKGNPPKGFKFCLRDGVEKDDVDGYGAGVMFITSSSKTRPPVVDRNLSPLTAEDGKPYAGCYVNATLRLWVQDNKYGKRVNAELKAVQFAKDGQPFGVAPVNVAEEFEALEGEDDPLTSGGDDDASTDLF
jgi:hypothetical protein